MNTTIQDTSSVRGQAPSLLTQKPTPASIWRAVTERPITDELLEWPADLFALTELTLERSEAYRFVLSAPGGVEWPPSRISNWPERVVEAGCQWSEWVEDHRGAIPGLLAEEWSVLRERADMPLEDLAEGRDWRLCEALLTLHAIADEACAGLGAALDRSDGKACMYRARGRELLARTGSMARIETHFLRVLPKTRTPPNGTSLRSFSRYACVRGPAVESRWYKIPCRHGGTDPTARHANLLLLPWPLRVRETDFHPLEDSVRRATQEPFGFFEFVPGEKLDLDLVSRLIVAAQDEVDSVDVLILPESAVDEEEVSELEALLDRHGVIMLIAGVRKHSTQPGQFAGNWVHMGVSPNLEKGGSQTCSTPQQWFHVDQKKHHRWSLDEGQIHQYHLGGTLHPHIRWWEAMDVPRRTLHFLEHGDEVTLVSLVCEDLAQIDDVAELIRAVGPTVVVTPLLDGPQLTSRWAARYASVLADDPGSAVLTLTSFGMVQRCRPQGRPPSQVVALWKDPIQGTREIPLDAGSQGVLLTVCGDLEYRSTADHRLPVGNMSAYFDVAVHQVRAASQGPGLGTSCCEAPASCVMEVEELTILTSWAEAVAEALAYVPERIETVLADAHTGAQWRSLFGLMDPPRRVAEGIDAIGRAIREITQESGAPTFDAMMNRCRKVQMDEPELDSLVRRVLRSTFEQLRTRQKAQSR